MATERSDAIPATSKRPARNAPGLVYLGLALAIVLSTLIGLTVPGLASGQAESTKGESVQSHAPALPSSANRTVDGAAKDLLELINVERSRADLAPLVFHEALSRVALLHACDMYDGDFFSHRSPTTGSPTARARRAAIEFTFYGENLAMAPSVSEAHRALMESPGHKANILSQDYSAVGLAVIEGRYPGTVIVVEEFMSPVDRVPPKDAVATN